MSSVQALPENSGPAWPSIRELEQWLARTAGESDQFASSLRRLLQVNAGYSKILVCDEELAAIAQLFAKRFRTQIQASESPIQAATLFRPLCEVIWRTTAHVIVSLSSLGGAVENMQPLLPKDAHGQLKALLKTLEDLNCKFCEARRNYLRELAMHRDKQRRLSESAQRVLHDLEERPVTFYDPLDSVLDTPTKEFVKQVVEERIKEGLQMSSVGKTTVEVPSQEHSNAEANKLQQEVRQLRATVAKGEDAQKRLEQAERRAHEVAAKVKTLTEALEEANRQLELKQQAQVVQARRSSAHATTEEPKDGGQAEELVRDLQERLTQREKLLDDLQRKLEQLKQEQALQESQLASEAEQVKELQEQLKMAAAEKRSEEPAAAPVIVKDEEALTKLKKKLDRQLQAEQKLREASLALEKALEEAEERAKKAEARAAAAEAAAAADAARATMAESAEVAAKAAAAAMVKRGAPPAREETAAPAQAPPAVVKVVEVREVVKVVEVQEARASSNASATSSANSIGAAAVNGGGASCITERTPDPPPRIEEDIEEEVRKATLHLQQKVQKQAEEIASLKVQVHGMASAAPTIKQETQKFVKQEPEEEPPEQQRSSSHGRATKWKAKCRALEEQCEALQEDKERLEAENASLVAALKENCSDEEVKAVLSKVKMAVPPQKTRKKKAFERLYDDAQRRMVEMKAKGKDLANVQKWVLADAAERAADQLSLQSVDMLVSLQEVSEATNMRFHDAVRQFQARVQDVDERRMSNHTPAVENTSRADSPPVSSQVPLLRRNSGSLIDDSLGYGVQLQGHAVGSRLCPMCRQPLPSAKLALKQRTQEWPAIPTLTSGSAVARGSTPPASIPSRHGSLRDLRQPLPHVRQSPPLSRQGIRRQQAPGVRSAEAAAVPPRTPNKEEQSSSPLVAQSARQTQGLLQSSREPVHLSDHSDDRRPSNFSKNLHLQGLNSLQQHGPGRLALDVGMEHGSLLPRPQQGHHGPLEPQPFGVSLRMPDRQHEGLLRQMPMADPAGRLRARSSPNLALVGTTSPHAGAEASPKQQPTGRVLVGIAGATSPLIHPASPLRVQGSKAALAST